MGCLLWDWGYVSPVPLLIHPCHATSKLLSLALLSMRTTVDSLICSTHRRSQDFVWGALFFPQKLTTIFSRRPQNTR